MELAKTMFKGIDQSWENWYSAKYLGGDEEGAKMLKGLFSLLNENGSAKAFMVDISKNLHLVTEHLNDPNYYDDKKEEIDVSLHHLVGTYDMFVRYKYTRSVMAQKMIPTYMTLTGTTVTATVKGNKIEIVDSKNEKVDIEKIKEVIGNHCSRNDENFSIMCDPTVTVIAEVAQKDYSEVEKIKPETLSVEKLVGADVIVSFLKDFKANVLSKKYIDQLKVSLQNKAQTIPVCLPEREGGFQFVNLNLPKILKSFMNYRHFFHDQDISRSILSKYGIDVAGRTPSELQASFFNKIEGGLGDSFVFNEVWLDTMSDIDVFEGYVPIYVGYKSCPWLFIKADVPSANGKSGLKGVLNFVKKSAKFYGLWLRGGMAGSVFSTYMNGRLGMKPTSVYGAYLHANMHFWISPIVIEDFKETSAIPMGEAGADIFDDVGEEDFDNTIFDKDFSPLVTPRIPLNRDEGELNDDPKKERGVNKGAPRRSVSKNKPKKKKKVRDENDDDASDSVEIADKDLWNQTD